MTQYTDALTRDLLVYRNALESGNLHSRDAISAAFAEFIAEDYGTRSKLDLPSEFFDRSWEFIGRYFKHASETEPCLSTFLEQYVRWAGLGDDPPDPLCIDSEEGRLYESLYTYGALGRKEDAQWAAKLLAASRGRTDWLSKYVVQVFGTRVMNLNGTSP